MRNLQRIVDDSWVEDNAAAHVRLRWGRVWSLRPLHRQLVDAIPPALPVQMLLKRAAQAPLVLPEVLLAE